MKRDGLAALRLLHVVRRHQDRAPLGGGLVQQIPHPLPGRRVGAGRGLVEEQDRRASAPGHSPGPVAA